MLSITLIEDPTIHRCGLVIGLSSPGIALAMAVLQRLCMNVAYQTIRSVRMAVNRQCHISSTNKYTGGLQVLHTADEDSLK